MIYVIPDTQVKQGVPNPLIPIAYHIAELKPSFIVHLGDHWDMPSLGAYDKGKKSHRVRTYRQDIEAGNKAMDEFWAILKKKWPQYKRKTKRIILVGNHEQTIHRAMEYGPDELVDLMDLIQRDYSNWQEVIPFLEVKEIKGIYFSHYFTQDKSDRPIGTAQQLLSKRHVPCIAGHQQGFDYKEQLTMAGTRIQAMIIGSCYLYTENYMGHTNHHWRGTVVLGNIKNGMYDFSRHSIQSLAREYGKTP